MYYPGESHWQSFVNFIAFVLPIISQLLGSRAKSNQFRAIASVARSYQKLVFYLEFG